MQWIPHQSCSKTKTEAGELVPWLKALAALPEVACSMPALMSDGSYHLL